MANVKKKSRERESTPRPPVRLAGITVENYKSIDSIRLRFPLPATPDDPDAFVLGSRNGVGKTSLLECCALSVIGAVYPDVFAGDRRGREPEPYGVLVRSGCERARIQALVSVKGVDHELEVGITPNKLSPPKEQSLREYGDRGWLRVTDEGDLLESLLGMNSEPLILPPLLLFHSYRKVLEGSSALGAMVDPHFVRRHYPPRRLGGPGPLSTFKVVLIQGLMARSGLFEGLPSRGDNEAMLQRLNDLLRDFVGGTVDKLRPGPDGTLELRVAPISGGASFSFDGLSSGQKEIIATLFLIWHATQNQPSVVLIDEPELHLNAEWQRIFLHRLTELSPMNQYILATHSEEVFASVRENRRLMLSR